MKTVKQVADTIQGKIEQMVKNELPDPDCALERQRNNWKREQVKKELGNRLAGPQGLHITVGI